MKSIKLYSLLILAILLFTACSSDDDHSSNNPENETEDLELVQSFQDGDYILDVWTKTGELHVGYNKVYLQIEDANGNYIEDAQVSWHPMMTMEMHDDHDGHEHHKTTDHGNSTTHHHSCPNSEITKVSNKKSLYETYVVFIMPSSDTDYWELNLHYNIAGTENEFTAQVNVTDLETDYYKIYTSAMGTDGENYILALIEPENPAVGINPMEVALFKNTEGGMQFPIVDDYQLQVDPRMPGMGNHSATGSENLTQNERGFYEGKVAFSMTGYWKINLILQNESGEIVKGEEVTDNHPESSLYFKLEF